MRLILLAAISLGIVSCRKCVECSYSYTNTSTEFTPDGEITITDTVNNATLEKDGFPYFQVCGNKEDRDEIEEYYKNAEANLDVTDYQYRCFEY